MKTSFRTPPFSHRAVPPSFRLLLLAALFVCWFLGALTGRAVTFRTLAAFNGTNGARPYGQMLVGADGSLYGTTSEGGSNNLGTVFAITPSGQLITLASFNGANGAKPLAGLIPGANGEFYGTTSAGGSNNCGTVFMLAQSDESWQLTTLVSFAGTNGLQPQGTLVQTADGNLYGTTLYGGLYGYGAVFGLTPAQGPAPGLVGGNPAPQLLGPPLSLVFSFDSTNSGALPAAGLTLGSDGNLYGTASVGGSLYNSGTLFEYIRRSGTVQTQFFFANTNGSSPQGSLVLGTDGRLYGTTAGGGTNTSKTGGYGTLFSFSDYSGFSSLCSFGLTNGSAPFAGVVQGMDGNFYGVTTAGGAKNRGALFTYNTNTGAVSLLYSFGGGSDGATPYAGLVQGTNGDFYGVTSAGGKYGFGTVFDVSGFAPYFIEEPSTNLAAQAGATLTLAVTAGGTAPLIYQWQLNSNNIGNGHGYSGANSPTLLITNSVPTDSGNYQVVVRNAYGIATSGVEVVTVVEPFGATPPTLRIASPAPNSYLSTTTPLIIGATGGTTAVAHVYFEVNGSGWQLASPLNGWSTWSASPSLSAGPNLFSAYAVNIAGTPSIIQQAIYIPGRFAPSASVAGTYRGLFYNTNQITTTNAGYFTLTMTRSATLSGSLLLAGAHYPLTGLVATNGSALALVPQPNQQSWVVTLQFDLTNGTDQVTGLITNENWQVGLIGDLAYYDGKTHVAPEKGRYTLIIPGSGSVASPGGDGWATVTVDAAGNIALGGSLADTTGLSQSATVSRYGLWPFFSSLYGGQGLIIGWLGFTNGPPWVVGGNVTWLKPPLSGAKYYPSGFTVSAGATGAAYAAPGAGTNVLNSTNAAVTFAGGNLGSRSITNLISLSSRNVAVNHSTNALSLSFTSTTGTFTGKVQDPLTRQMLPFSGVMLQNQDQGVGYFTGANQTGQVEIVP